MKYCKNLIVTVNIIWQRMSLGLTELTGKVSFSFNMQMNLEI